MFLISSLAVAPAVTVAARVKIAHFHPSVVRSVDKTRGGGGAFRRNQGSGASLAPRARRSSARGLYKNHHRRLRVDRGRHRGVGATYVRRQRSFASATAWRRISRAATCSSRSRATCAQKPRRCCSGVVARSFRTGVVDDAGASKSGEGCELNRRLVTSVGGHPIRKTTRGARASARAGARMGVEA